MLQRNKQKKGRFGCFVEKLFFFVGHVFFLCILATADAFTRSALFIGIRLEPSMSVSKPNNCALGKAALGTVSVSVGQELTKFLSHFFHSSLVCYVHP